MNLLEEEKKLKLQHDIIMAAKAGDLQRVKYYHGQGVSAFENYDNNKSAFFYLLQHDVCSASEFMLQQINIKREKIKSITERLLLVRKDLQIVKSNMGMI